MPERPLTLDEQFKLALELTDEQKRFSALDTLMKEKTNKGTLHDFCLLELKAKLDAQQQIIIEQGREIKALQAELKYMFHP
jgi:hypothetical protein